MGDSWSGKPIEITPGTPKDVAALRKSLISTLTGKMAGGATPYSGSVAYGFDPLQTNAANIMSQYTSGNPYTPNSGIRANTGGGGGTTLNRGGGDNGIIGFNNKNKYSGLPGWDTDPRNPPVPPDNRGNPTPPFTNPSAPPGTCFVAGTPILMADKSEKPIEDIKCGDSVLSYDTQKDKFHPAEVSEIRAHLPEEVNEVLLINGHIGVTPEHPVWINGVWDKIGHAKLLDELMGSDGKTVEIVSIATLPGNVPVYHFHTNHKTHNYFAGGILAHNLIPKQQDPFSGSNSNLMTLLAMFGGGRGGFGG